MIRWDAWIALASAVFTGVGALVAVAAAVSAMRSRRAAADSAATALAEARRANEIQASLLAFQKQAHAQPTIKAIFGWLTFVAKVAANTPGFANRWNEAESAIGKAFENIAFHMPELADYLNDFRKRYDQARDYQRQREKGMPSSQLQQLLPKVEEQQEFFNAKIGELVEKFKPYLDIQVLGLARHP